MFWIFDSPQWYTGSMVPVDHNSCPMCGVSISETMRHCPACGEILATDDGRPQSNSSVVEDFAKAKRRRLIWLLELSIAVGVGAQFFTNAQTEIQIAATIGIVLLVGSWCNIDARERDYKIGKGQFAAIVLFAIVGLPVYFIRTRGIRGVVSILLALLFYFGMIVLQLIAMLITSFMV